MITDTNKKILDYIKKRGQASGVELSEYLAITDRAVRKQLNKLIESGLLIKIGKPPKVYYLIADKIEEKEELVVEDNIKNIIHDNYLIITPAGEKIEGWDGFVYWCKKNKLPIEKTAKEYIRTLEKYDKFKKNGLIDGMHKLKTTFNEVYLDKVFYLDFYSIERFGKTKLGQLLLYAKQSQDKVLMKELIKVIQPKVFEILKKYNIDGIGYVPPTVKRETQFMKVLAKNLYPGKRTVTLVKVKTPITVPQKTLNKLQDRIENAKRSIIVDDNSAYDNILLIDDAVGSGATLNETAKKIKELKMSKGKIIGLAITGSFKGFDVISEV